MTVTNALASLAVADLDAASAWYQRLLGPGTRPMPELVEWQFDGGGGLQIYLAPERAGHGSCTMVVDDIDVITARVLSAGLADDARPQHHDTVDTLMITDPDGNSIAFAKAHTDDLAR